MVEIVEVKSKKDIKEFIEFSLRLYKNCPYFVPMIYGDEKKMFKPGFVYIKNKKRARSEHRKRKSEAQLRLAKQYIL